CGSCVSTVTRQAGENISPLSDATESGKCIGPRVRARCLLVATSGEWCQFLYQSAVRRKGRERHRTFSAKLGSSPVHSGTVVEAARPDAHILSRVELLPRGQRVALRIP